MRNILLVQFETKIALVIVSIAIVIFLIMVFKGVNNFNKSMEEINSKGTDLYEEVRF